MSTALFLLGLYNRTAEFIKQSIEAGASLLNATCNYLNGTSSEWYFLPFGFLPATAYPQKNRVYWTYNTYQNTLVQKLRVEPAATRLRWLSTILYINNTEYVIDDWIRTLYIVMQEDSEFTPALLINCWSIYHKIWSNDEEATLHIIDMEGESHTISMNDDRSDEWIRLLFEQEASPPVEAEAEEVETETEEVEKEVEAEKEAEEAEETSVEQSPPLLPVFSDYAFASEDEANTSVPTPPSSPPPEVETSPTIE
jgi:hypothetical protein